CGLHIEQALEGVPIKERCKCSKDSRVGKCILLRKI
ncbi:unnamed protein product, partial [Rotaria magnacalcarata]